MSNNFLEDDDYQEIIQKLNVVSVQISSRSGTVAVPTARSKESSAFTSGAVRYIDPKCLLPFSRLRSAVATLFLHSGVKFMGGCGVPDAKFDKFKDELIEIVNKVETAKAELAADIRGLRETWENDHPEIMKYKSYFPSDADFMSGIGVAVKASKVHPKPLDGVDDGIASEVGSLAEQVLNEIALDASRSFDAKSKKASTRARDVLERMISKLDALGFVNTSLANVSKMVQDVLDLMPATGPIKDANFKAYASLMKALSSPRTVIRVADMLCLSEASHDTSEDMWAAFDDAADETDDAEKDEADTGESDDAGEADEDQNSRQSADAPSDDDPKETYADDDDTSTSKEVDVDAIVDSVTSSDVSEEDGVDSSQWNW